MMKKLLALCLGGYSALAVAGFDVVALGVDGGVSDGNLTSYLIRSDSQTQYLALDAGTLLPGIAKGLEKGSFPQVTPELAAPLTPQGYIFRQLIGGYFISHGHLDHVAGLILASPEDSKKTVYAQADTVLTLRNHYFNWKAWPNFTDAGNGSRLGTYRLQTLRPQQRVSLGLTGLSGVMYPLSHDRYPSSMLLVADREGAFAYFGDTGPDVLEQSRNLDGAWRVLGPLIEQKKLKGMIIETSYPNEVDDKHLYGHLTPAWLLKELKNLQQYSGGEGSLKDLPVIISHIKPSLKQGEDVRATIKQQLDQGNDLGVKFILMEQGDRQQF
ncbi:3',5'-cyclic-nucleotide phosphodiesterase [Serratia fonticola]|uniref:MBL fold metallo-hydrolase n=1 Tax=Serratia fonticola TaxID=47917 RepID=UPI0015C69352|nr:MBL fold metallo-hydrolase [Serratia fonticola]MBC3379081.1 3',5'-cyclic-nucleotide phosphodiesterase [Serratia fonticola]NYA38281.1 3',5'-cyclic-nucleotide phosphodiesterase [Serratia fonticola]